MPAKPTITKIDPNSGPIGGGTNVTINGTGLETAAWVWFGEKAVAPTDKTQSHCNAKAPAQAAATVPVYVVTKAGQSDTVDYTYEA